MQYNHDFGFGFKRWSYNTWIYKYIDGNIFQSQLEGFIYDKPISKPVRLDSSINCDNLCNLLYSKLKIDSSKSGLKLFHKCKNLDDLKFEIVPIEGR